MATTPRRRPDGREPWPGSCIAKPVFPIGRDIPAKPVATVPPRWRFSPGVRIDGLRQGPIRRIIAATNRPERRTPGEARVTRFVSRQALACGLCLTGGFAPAISQTSDFYRGKTISLVVNYTSGGPTDTEARLLARHLPKHIPGAPTIIVRNMGGAGGMIGVNWLGQVAAADGLTVGYMTGVVGASAHETPALKVDATKFPFVSGVEGITVYYARTDLGVSRPADLMTKKNFWMGGLTPDNDKDLRLRASLDLLGIPYRYISGYPGAAEARLALERNEIQFTAESMPTWRVSIEPSLVKSGQVVATWYDTQAAASGVPHPDAGGIDALPFESFYRRVKGEPPDSDLWRMQILLKEIGATFQRTINFPPGAPQEAVDVWRKAIVAVEKDAEYRADAEKTIKYVPRFLTGPRIEKIFFESMRVDPKLKAFIHDYIDKGKAMVGK